MTEIERRLYKYYRITRYGVTTTRQRAREDIIDPWNAAVEAMKDAASYAYSSGYTYCRVCRLAKVMGHQEWCFVGKLQAAIALMEGTDAEDN